MTNERPFPTLAELERQHGIPPDRYCGLTPQDMSRAIVAYHAGPRRPGEPLGYDPIASRETRIGWLREAFGADADIERLLLLEQFFAARIDALIKVDWMQPDAEFDRAVATGLREHFPELTEEARQVIAGNFSYSHK